MERLDPAVANRLISCQPDIVAPSLMEVLGRAVVPRLPDELMNLLF
jgi:hypothetical protein